MPQNFFRYLRLKLCCPCGGEVKECVIVAITSTFNLLLGGICPLCGGKVAVVKPFEDLIKDASAIPFYADEAEITDQGLVNLRRSLQ